MNLDNLVSFISVQLLRMDDKTYGQAAKDVSLELGGYELDQPQKVGMFSIGAVDHKQNLIGYWSWLEELRASGFHIAKVSMLGGQGELPTHIDAAFANGVSQVLTVASENKNRTYLPQVEYARSTWLTGPELETILDFQFADENMKEQLWKEILIKDANRYGDYMEASTIQEAQEFIKYGYEKVFYSTNDILRTAQHFCANQGTEFNIPPALAPKLEQNLSAEDARFFGNYDPYPHEKLGASEIVELVNAQSDKDSWNKILRELLCMAEWLPDLNKSFHPKMSPEEVERCFLKLTPEDLNEISLGNITTVFGQPLIVPKKLKSKFTFPELPPVPEEELWRTKENPDFWQMLCFKFLEETPASKQISDENRDLKPLIEDFACQLKAAETFAKRVESPFAEAFAISYWILKSDNLVLDDEEKLTHAAKGAGFSERALMNLQRIPTMPFHKILRLSPLHNRVLMALELANVFGGMSSWNDQFFTDEQDQEQFKRVSTSLFASLIELHAASLVNTFPVRI